MSKPVLLLSVLLFLLPACDDDPGDTSAQDTRDSTMGIPDIVPDSSRPDVVVDATVDSDTPPPDGPRVLCPTALPAPEDGALCSTTPGTSGYVLLEGVVLAGENIFDGGAVLYAGDPQGQGRIVCVGCDCASAPEAAEATRVSCPDGIISPGLINAHDHITFSESGPVPHGEERFDHRTDWRGGERGHSQLRRDFNGDSTREGVLYGELRLLYSGTTSVTGSIRSAGDVSGLLRNLDDTEDLGYTEGLSGVGVFYSTFPLDDLFFSALDVPIGTCDYADFDRLSSLDYPIYYPHIAEGIDPEANNEFFCLSTPEGQDMVQSNTTIVHAIGMSASDIRSVAVDNAKIVWSPRTNIDLYGHTTDVVSFAELGVTIGLGTDWPASGSMNMLRELACADSYNQNHLGAYFSDYDLWRMATLGSAESMGAADQIGLLAEGYFADIAVFDGSGARSYRSIFEANVENVMLVTRGGKPLYGDAPLIEALVRPVDLQLCETEDVCGVPKRLCVELDTGLSRLRIERAVEFRSLSPLLLRSARRRALLRALPAQ